MFSFIKVKRRKHNTRKSEDRKDGASTSQTEQVTNNGDKSPSETIKRRSLQPSQTSVKKRSNSLSRDTEAPLLRSSSSGVRLRSSNSRPRSCVVSGDLEKGAQFTIDEKTSSNLRGSFKMTRREGVTIKHEIETEKTLPATSVDDKKSISLNKASAGTDTTESPVTTNWFRRQRIDPNSKVKKRKKKRKKPKAGEGELKPQVPVSAAEITVTQKKSISNNMTRVVTDSAPPPVDEDGVIRCLLSELIERVVILTGENVVPLESSSPVISNGGVIMRQKAAADERETEGRAEKESLPYQQVYSEKSTALAVVADDDRFRGRLPDLLPVPPPRLKRHRRAVLSMPPPASPSMIAVATDTFSSTAASADSAGGGGGRRAADKRQMIRRNSEIQLLQYASYFNSGISDPSPFVGSKPFSLSFSSGSGKATSKNLHTTSGDRFWSPVQRRKFIAEDKTQEFLDDTVAVPSKIAKYEMNSLETISPGSLNSADVSTAINDEFFKTSSASRQMIPRKSASKENLPKTIAYSPSLRQKLFASNLPTNKPLSEADQSKLMAAPLASPELSAIHSGFSLGSITVMDKVGRTELDESINQHLPPAPHEPAAPFPSPANPSHPTIPQPSVAALQSQSIDVVPDPMTIHLQSSSTPASHGSSPPHSGDSRSADTAATNDASPPFILSLSSSNVTSTSTIPLSALSSLVTTVITPPSPSPSIPSSGTFSSVSSLTSSTYHSPPLVSSFLAAASVSNGGQQQQRGSPILSPEVKERLSSAFSPFNRHSVSPIGHGHSSFRPNPSSPNTTFRRSFRKLVCPKEEITHASKSGSEGGESLFSRSWNSGNTFSSRLRNSYTAAADASCQSVSSSATGAPHQSGSTSASFHSDIEQFRLRRSLRVSKTLTFLGGVGPNKNLSSGSLSGKFQLKHDFSNNTRGGGTQMWKQTSNLDEPRKISSNTFTDISKAATDRTTDKNKFQRSINSASDLSTITKADSTKYQHPKEGQTSEDGNFFDFIHEDLKQFAIEYDNVSFGSQSGGRNSLAYYDDAEFDPDVDCFSPDAKESKTAAGHIFPPLHPSEDLIDDTERNSVHDGDDAASIETSNTDEPIDHINAPPKLKRSKRNFIENNIAAIEEAIAKYESSFSEFAGGTDTTDNEEDEDASGAQGELINAESVGTTAGGGSSTQGLAMDYDSVIDQPSQRNEKEIYTQAFSSDHDQNPMLAVPQTTLPYRVKRSQSIVGTNLSLQDRYNAEISFDPAGNMRKIVSASGLGISAAHATDLSGDLSFPPQGSDTNHLYYTQYSAENDGFEPESEDKNSDTDNQQMYLSSPVISSSQDHQQFFSSHISSPPPSFSLITSHSSSSVPPPHPPLKQSSARELFPITAPSDPHFISTASSTQSSTIPLTTSQRQCTATSIIGEAGLRPYTSSQHYFDDHVEVSKNILDIDIAAEASASIQSPNVPDQLHSAEGIVRRSNSITNADQIANLSGNIDDADELMHHDAANAVDVVNETVSTEAGDQADDDRVLSMSTAGRETSRAHAVSELLNIEIQHVKTLEDVIEGYKRPAEQAFPPMFSLEQLSRLFSNIEQLLIFSTDLVTELRRCVVANQPHMSSIGDIFSKRAAQFQSLYSIYCVNYLFAISELQYLYKQEFNRYSQFFEACRLLRNLMELPLEGFLLTPVQRICRYPLQLTELLKYTTVNHPDYK